MYHQAPLPSLSASIPLKEASFGLPVEGLHADNRGEEESTESSSDSSDTSESLDSSNTEIPDSRLESGQSDHQIAGTRAGNDGRGDFEKNGLCSCRPSSEEDSQQQQESQQQQGPLDQIAKLVRREHVGARLKGIMRAGECYVCPIAFWRATDEIQLLMEGASEVPVLGVTKQQQEQQVLREVRKWVGLRYEVISLPQISASRYVRQMVDGKVHVVHVYFTEAFPKKSGK
ncbi:hypothetical protein CBR_g53756 [Chara braunii]|uniref:Uncharacterized protein n=1 Tax=Chara braunii TaxID=69332 RepID=A0A388K6X6_CHABU|nr:hypothetical protein CBR_g53756 [Chara braunii]|eukprot:GBG65787.1 hypothetical protein CBR_g53756 [Chara braunii]